MRNFLRITAATLSAGMLLGPLPANNQSDREYGFCPVRPYIRQSFVQPESPPIPPSTLEHRLFLEEHNGTIRQKITRETIPDIDNHTFLFRLVLQHRDNTIIFYDKKNPTRILDIQTLPETSPEWQRVANDIDKRRTYMIGIAQARELQVANQHKMSRNSISFRIGSQDRFNECLQRSLPYFLPGKQILESFGLPWQAFFLGCQESDWRPHLTSQALCVGTHQINEWNGRHYGGIVPRTTSEQRNPANVGKTIGWLLGQPDERRHPLIAIHIAANLLRKDSYSTGSALAAINAYIAGPNNIDPIRAYATHTNNNTDQEPFEWLASAMSGGWQEVKKAGERNPAFRSQYGKFSSEYVARLLAAVSEIPQEYFIQAQTHSLNAEIITIQYTGKKLLRGRDIAAFLGEEEYRQRNPHLPLGAVIPEGMRVELPLGAAETFFAQNYERILPSTSIQIRNGQITTNDGTPPFLIATPTNNHIDLQFSQIAERRRAGEYAQSDTQEIATLITDLEKICEVNPSAFCQYQLGTLKLDLDLYTQQSRKRLIQVIETQREKNTRTLLAP